MKKNLFNQFRPWHLYTGYCLTAFLLIMVLTSARYAKSNFTGEWHLSKEKSKLSEGQMRIIFNHLKITQNANDLNVARTGQSPTGQEFTMDEKITLDGKEAENQFFEGVVKKKSTAKWSADEKVLTITSTLTFSRDGNEITMKSTEVWDSSNGPNELIINNATTTPNGETKDIYVYTKK